MIGEVLGRLLDRRALRPAEVRSVFNALTARATDESDRAALLVALTARGDRPDELIALAREMRRRARPFPVPVGDGAVDLCGSGGARTPSFNVSTVSAFVVRAAGVRVVKHGNRSRRVCGSSDLLEALGLPVVRSRAYARATYRKQGIAFLHAPLFHPAMAALAPTRARLGIATVFNRLGPLSNPAQVRVQVVGVPDRATVEVAPRLLRALGVPRGIAMTSEDGCDEFSPRSATRAVAWSPGALAHRRILPHEYLDAEDRRGSWGALPAPAAAEEAERILAGGGGARRGSVLLTSGAALWRTGNARDLHEGVAQARGALDSGEAERILAAVRSIAPGYARGDGS
jgi:anthranilate phosphoribosyltransferase